VELAPSATPPVPAVTDAPLPSAVPSLVATFAKVPTDTLFSPLARALPPSASALSLEDEAPLPIAIEFSGPVASEKLPSAMPFKVVAPLALPMAIAPVLRDPAPVPMAIALSPLLEFPPVPRLIAPMPAA
jgi:hypothetical protein